MSEDERRAGWARRPDHWVYLDRWWAQRLGVTRTAGMYRIRSRELVRRLSQERLGVDASGTVYAYGTKVGSDQLRPASGSSRATDRLHHRVRGY